MIFKHFMIGLFLMAIMKMRQKGSVQSTGLTTMKDINPTTADGLIEKSKIIIGESVGGK